MPWSQTTPMHQRMLFIADHLRGSRSVTELCADYGISRKTGYMWIDRYIRRGPAGLEDRSRRPRRAANATATVIVNALVELRHRHPTWGATAASLTQPPSSSAFAFNKGANSSAVAVVPRVAEGGD